MDQAVAGGERVHEQVVLALLDRRPSRAAPRAARPTEALGPAIAPAPDAERTLERRSGRYQCGFAVPDVDELLGCAELIADAFLAENAVVEDGPCQ